MSMAQTSREIVHNWTLHRPHEGQKELRRLLAKPDAKVIVAVLGRRWGKTTGAIEALAELAIQRRLQIGWFAHVARSMKVAWEHACLCIPNTAIAKKAESGKTLTLLNGSRIQMGSLDEPDNILGWGYDIIVIDEGARVSRYARDEILAPMVADRNGVILVITTPKGKKGRSAWVYRDYKKAEMRTPGYYRMRGPSTQNPLPSIREWALWAKENLPSDTYKQEILAEFLDHGGGIIDLAPICTLGGSEDRPVKLPYRVEPEWACKLKDRTLEYEPVSVGIDIAATQNYTVVAGIGMTSRRLCYLDRFHRIGWPAQIARIKTGVTWCGKRRAMVRLDATGMGNPVGSMLSRAHVSFTPVVFTNEEKTSLVQGLQVSVEQREWAMPWITEAVAEAESYEADVLSSGRMKYGAAEGFTDDIITALALAVQGIQKRISGVPT